jgi:hydrogenase nickel incorporation protein HypA/HybF
MHETSVAEEVLNQMRQFRDQRSGPAITAVHLAVGKLSCINVEALTEALGIATGGTYFERTEFVIKEVLPKVECTACGELFDFGPMRCPKCGHIDKKIIYGQELVISSIETDE